MHYFATKIPIGQSVNLVDRQRLANLITKSRKNPESKGQASNLRCWRC